MSNSISFTGRIGKDAVVKQVGQSSVCEFSAANDQGFGDKKSTIWFNCHLWGKQGDALAQYLVKGKQVWISGELTLREYDGKDGRKTSAEVRVHAIDLVGDKGTRQDTAAPVANAPTTPASVPHDSPAAPEVDLPF